DGKQGGKPANRFCCGYGGANPVGCSDGRCSDEPGESCASAPALACCGDGVCDAAESGSGSCGADDCSGGAGWCGDGVCDSGEDYLTCGTDCAPPDQCGDGVCDPWEDDTCSDCGGAPLCVNPGGAPVGDDCSSDGDCCSNKCRGSRGRKTCR
ncbi:MAG: hypothetical protein R3190_15885, partial [Thermoanaerobaculia bacterium]|nr:hypothetical protein [Thermoanaerobaculia bacterium]